MIKIDTIVVGQWACNCYIVSDTETDGAIIIDPGDDADYIISSITSLCVKPVKIISTHGHFDHNMASFEIQQAYKVPFMISKNDMFLLKKMPQSAKYFTNVDAVKVPKPDGFLKEVKNISFSDSYFKIIEVPGHTPGSVALYSPHEKIVFVGDLLFKDGSIGRYDFSYSSKMDLFKSIDKILSLPKDTVIYPGHGDNTTVAKELEYHSKISDII